MKKLLTYSALLLLGLSLTMSCSKKDEAQPSLVGSWKFSSIVFSACTNSADNGTETCTQTANECGVITFTSSTWSYYQTPTGAAPIAESGTYSTSGSSVTLSGSSSITGTYTYSISGSTLTISHTNSSSGCTETITMTKV